MSDAYKELKRIADALEKQNEIASTQVGLVQEQIKLTREFHEYCYARDAAPEEMPPPSRQMLPPPALPAGFQELPTATGRTAPAEAAKADRKKSSRRDGGE